MQSELEKHGNEPVWLTRAGPDAPIPDYINDPVGVLRGMQANALQVWRLSLCSGRLGAEKYIASPSRWFLHLRCRILLDPASVHPAVAFQFAQAVGAWSDMPCIDPADAVRLTLSQASMQPCPVRAAPGAAQITRSPSGREFHMCITPDQLSPNRHQVRCLPLTDTHTCVPATSACRMGVSLAHSADRLQT